MATTATTPATFESLRVREIRASKALDRATWARLRTQRAAGALTPGTASHDAFQKARDAEQKAEAALREARRDADTAVLGGR